MSRRHGHRRKEVADHHVRAVDADELLRGLDATLGIALAVLAADEADLDLVSVAHRFDARLQILDADPGRFQPRLAGLGEIARQADEHAEFQIELGHLGGQRR